MRKQPPWLPSDPGLSLSKQRAPQEPADRRKPLRERQETRNAESWNSRRRALTGLSAIFVAEKLAPPARLERTEQSQGKTAVLKNGGARGGAVGVENTPLDPDLQAIIDAWQTLPESVKADILAMVEAG